jgi:SAM-dependent methyltransferase
MTTQQRWEGAQQAESEYWNFLAAADVEIERVLGENAKIAERLRSWLPELPSSVAEIGVGGLGVGVLGYLPEVAERVGVDPLPPPPLTCSDAMRERVELLRKGVRLVTAPGELTPLPQGHFGLAICCNVLDHVRSPQQVVSEVKRFLKPGGYFYLDVDVFSFAGLAKWHLWTKHTHRNEILVRAHPHRFLQRDLSKYLNHAGFRTLRQNNVSFHQSYFGRSWDCQLLAQKIQA